MAKPRIKLTTAYDSPETLVFRCQKSRRNSDDITPNRGAKWRWGRFESGDLYHRTTLPLRRSTAATLCSSAMTDANDAFTVAERYRRTAINNVRSKSITAVVYFNSRCARTVPSTLAELLVFKSGNMQHFTRIQLTVCSRSLYVSWTFRMNLETTDKRIVYARNTESG